MFFAQNPQARKVFSSKQPTFEQISNWIEGWPIQLKESLNLRLTITLHPHIVVSWLALYVSVVWPWCLQTIPFCSIVKHLPSGFYDIGILYNDFHKGFFCHRILTSNIILVFKKCGVLGPYFMDFIHWL